MGNVQPPGADQGTTLPAGSEEAPFVLGSFTDRKWRGLGLGDQAQDDVRALSTAAEAALRDELSLIVNAETLVVLAGSGSSFAVGQKDGTRPAPSMNTLWDAVSELPEFIAAASKLNPELVSRKNLEHVLSDAQARQLVSPEDVDINTFIAAAEDKVLRLCSFVDEDTDVSGHEIFLRKVARRSTRLQRTQLFTTNYDLVFETAARRARFNIIDGFGYAGREFDGASFDLDFVRRRPNEELSLEPSVFHLLKLHGSVDWTADADIIRKVQGAPSTPVLIYPSAAKYQMSYQQPYLEFMSRFQIALRQPDVGLIVVGYGFNDDHLNAPIEAALRSNIGLRAITVTPAARDPRRADSIAWIEDLVQRGDRRLTLFAGSFDDLVQRLPETPPQEERDAHAVRISQRTGRDVG